VVQLNSFWATTLSNNHVGLVDFVKTQLDVPTVSERGVAGWSCVSFTANCSRFSGRNECSRVPCRQTLHKPLNRQ